jgi:hypothetical protein
LPPAGLNGILDETLPFDAPVELFGASRDREFFAYIGGPARMRGMFSSSVYRGTAIAKRE